MSDLKIDLDAESFFEMKPSSIAQIECYVCDESTSPDFGFCFRCGADFRASKNEEGSHSVWVVRSGGQPHWPKFFSEVGARPVPIKLGRTWRKLIGGIPKDLAEMIVAKAARCEIHARVQRDTFRAYLFNFKGVVLTGILIAIPAVPILFLSLLAVAFYAYDLIVEFHKSNLDLFSYLQNAIYNTFFYPSRFRGGTLKPQVLQLLGMYTVISGIIAVWLSSAWRVAKRPMIEGWAQNTSSFLSELPQTKIVLRSLKQDESRRWVKKIFDAFNTLYVRTPETEIGARRNLKDLYKVQLQLLKCHDVALARWQHSQKSSLEEMFAAEDSFQAISTRLIRVQMTVETEIRKKLMPQKTKEQGADIAAQIADTAAYVDAYRQLQSGSEAA